MGRHLLRCWNSARYNLRTHYFCYNCNQTPVQCARYIAWLIVGTLLFLNPVSGCVNPWISDKGTMQCCARGHCAPKSTSDGCCNAQNPSDGKALSCTLRAADHTPQLAALPLVHRTYSVLLPQVAVEVISPFRHPPPKHQNFPLPLLI